MDKFAITLRDTFGENRVRENESLSAHTALKVGGISRLYVEVDKSEELVKAVQLAHEATVPFLVIGSGSKTLISDAGYDGLVIKNNSRKFDVLSRKGKIRNNKIDVDRAYVYADSGAFLNQVVRFAIEQEFAGIEEALGIPGTVGGALYTQQTAEQLTSVLYQIQAITYDGRVIQVTDHDLLYADSRGVMRKGKFVVLSVIFELFPGHSATLWEKGTRESERRNKEKPESPFSYQAFSDITVAEAMSIPTPKYRRDASYLLEKAGLSGKKVGEAMLSEEFANYIVNSGNATADAMIALLRECEETVRKKFGVRLQPTFTIITG